MSAPPGPAQAAHQIVLRAIQPRQLYGHSSKEIIVSCSCLAVPRHGRSGYWSIEARSAFPAAEAVAAWRAWHAERGMIV